MCVAALSSATSGLISATISVLIIGVMQIFKAPIADSQLGTIFGGFLGSQLFVFLLTVMRPDAGQKCRQVILFKG